MPEKLQTRCVIAGGGPAGIMAGYLLARAGVPVIVLEKHADFFRDFRGDTIHPSTLELMYELGLLEEFLKPLGMSVNQFAKRLAVDATRLNDIVRGRRGISADTALRLARYLGTSAEFWMGLQANHDLWHALRKRSAPVA